MTTFRSILALALLPSAFVATALHPREVNAQVTGPHATATVFGGGINWDNKVNLNGNPVFGGRLGFMVNEYFGIEGTLQHSSTTTRNGPTPWTVPDTPPGGVGSDMSVNRAQVSLLAQLAPHARLSPYLVGGWSRIRFSEAADAGFEEHDTGYDLGAGVMLRATPRLGIRVEGRDFGFRFHNPNPYGDEMNNNIQFTIGAQYSLGGRIWTPVEPVVNVTNVTNVTEITPAPAPVKVVSTADADRDGVPDVADLCPYTPANARVDKDGCPIEVTDLEREILETGVIVLNNVNFEFDKSNLLPESHAVLDEVGRTLVQWPELRIEIGGHTDAKGTAAYNHDLSHRRAGAVLDYLLAAFPQIKREQWTTVGYGEEKPLATSATEAGAAMNRRVDFKVLNNETLEHVRERRHILYKGGGN